MINCEYCSTGNEEGALECRRCGAPLPKSERKVEITFVSSDRHEYIVEYSDGTG